MMPGILLLRSGFAAIFYFAGSISMITVLL